MPFSGGLGSRSRAGVVHGMHGGRSAAQRPDAGAGPRRPSEPSPRCARRARRLPSIPLPPAASGRRSRVRGAAPSRRRSCSRLPRHLRCRWRFRLRPRRSWRYRGAGRSSPRGSPATQTEFRLLFVTSTTRNAASIEHRRLQPLRAGPRRRRAFLDPVLFLEIPGLGQHRRGARARQHLDHLHVFGQGPVDLVAERRQGRGPLRGFLRRQLGQRERKERARAMLRGPVVGFGGSAPDVVDRDQQQWHQGRQFSREFGGSAISGSTRTGAPATVPIWQSAELLMALTSSDSLPNATLRPLPGHQADRRGRGSGRLDRVEPDERHLRLRGGRDHPGTARLRRGRVGDGLALRGAEHRQGGAPGGVCVRLRHAPSRLRIHGAGGDYDAGGGLRFGRHLAVLGHVPGSGLRADFAQWREHLRAVRLPFACRARPAGSGQPAGAQGRRDAGVRADDLVSAGRCPIPSMGFGAGGLAAEARWESGPRTASAFCSPRRRAMPPLRTSTSTTTACDRCRRDGTFRDPGVQERLSGSSPAPGRWMRGTTPGSPGPRWCRFYWMGSGNKVADNYADLLDGSWDSENESPTNAERGTPRIGPICLDRLGR